MVGDWIHTKAVDIDVVVSGRPYRMVVRCRPLLQKCEGIRASKGMRLSAKPYSHFLRLSGFESGSMQNNRAKALLAQVKGLEVAWGTEVGFLLLEIANDQRVKEKRMIWRKSCTAVLV